MVDRITSDIPGRDVLDVGIGTGVSARPFRAAGCRVLGVEVDARMAAFARQDGFDVEAAKFEDWEAEGRTFDLIIAGTAWHWIDPAAGARKAAQLLRPNGRLAAFWNVAQPPPDLARAFSAVYRRLLPGTPYARAPSDPLAAYEQVLTTTADAMLAIGAFSEPRRWQVDWEQTYTTGQWLDQVPTFGGHSRFPPMTLQALTDGIGAAIDAMGGRFPMRYATVTITATRPRG